MLNEFTKVSSKHARVFFKNGRFHLQDLGSKRGTYIKVGTNFKLEVGM